MIRYIKLPPRAEVDETGEFPLTTEAERQTARQAMRGRYSSAPVWARESDQEYQTGEWFDQGLPWQSHPLYTRGSGIGPGSYMTDKEFKKKYPAIFEAAYRNRIDR